MASNSTSIQRNEFFESLETYMSLSTSSGKMMGLILVDIENFSQINKEFGYQTGEMFIFSIFKKIEVLANFFNCVFRISDSSFALILPVVQSENMLVLATNKILSEVKGEYDCNNTLISASPKIGLAHNDIDSNEAEVLFKKAEKRLLLAKDQSKTFVLPTSEELKEPIENFSQKFHTALTNNEFELYYQPKTDLATGTIHQVEALLRWNIQDDIFISPEAIVAEAEKSDENNFNLTKWVINRALRQLREWLDDDFALSVSVNVSASLIHRKDLLTMIEDSLKIWGVSAELLTIEITETAFMTNKQLCHENLKNMRDLGIKLSIDDFGTGYSSLSYFKQIPANELKIDKSFVLNLMESQEDRKLVRLMIKIAHSFNLKVVAEGIENKECYKYLHGVECDYAQGYFIAKPQPAEQFIGWLAENK